MKKLLFIFAFASLLAGQVRIPGPGGLPAAAPPAGITVNQLTDSSGAECTSDPCSAAAISPTANALVVAAIGISVVGGGTMDAGDTISVSGCSLDWTLRATTTCNTGTPGSDRRRIWIYSGTSATPGSACQIAFDFTSNAAATHESKNWSIDEFTGHNASTPFGTFQVGHTSAATAISTANLGAPDAGDWVYGAFAVEGATVSATINGELDTTLSNIGGGVGLRTLLAGVDQAPDGSPTPGITWTGTNGGCGIAAHLNVAP